ncbi:hypothetical protein JTB14_017440 [Gonioctena quinquepunctata]|nr:hypothetical protein JTB14_017440 [Gonioctena quinquepunctata]
MAHQLVFFITSWLFSTSASFEIHKHMSLEEIRNTFHVDTHKLVPEYELVPVQHVRKRSFSPDHLENVIEDGDPESSAKKGFESKKLESGTTKLKLRAFGTPYNLSLIPTDGLFKKGKLKIWTIEPNATAQHGVEYVELPEFGISRQNMSRNINMEGVIAEEFNNSKPTDARLCLKQERESFLVA